MNRLLFIALFIFLNACSFNIDSKYWNEKSDKKNDNNKLTEIIKKSNLNSDYTLSSMKKNRKDNMAEALDSIESNRNNFFHDENDGHLYEIDQYTGLLYEIY